MNEVVVLSAKNENIEKARKMHEQGISLVEIASQLSVPQGTVRSWKNRYKWGDNECNATERSVATKKRNVANKDKAKSKVVALEVKQVLENPDLNDRQRLFCLYYSKSFNATQSYLKSYGCSYETAMANGSALLSNAKVCEEIQKLKQLKLQQIVVGEEDMIEFHMRIAFADIGDYVSFGREEVPVMSMFGPVKDEAGNELKKEINTVKLKESNQVDTQLIKEIKQGRDGVGIKLLDRCKSMDWLDRYFLMNPMDRHKIEFDKRKLELEEKKADGGEDTKTINLVHSVPRRPESGGDEE